MTTGAGVGFAATKVGRLGRRGLGVAMGAAVLGGAASRAPASEASAASASTLDKRVARLLRRGGSACHRAAVVLVDRRLRRVLPTLLGAAASDPSSPLRSALAEVYQPRGTCSPLDERAGAGLLPASARLMSWDEFDRSDRPLHGDRSPSGHEYRVSGTAAHLVIRNRRHAPTPVPRRADILYVDEPHELAVLAAEYVWTSGTTNSQNTVIGACAVGFGRGSVQLAVYADTPRNLGVDWLLFCVLMTGSSVTYESIAEGSFVEGFAFVHDGLTRYRTLLHRTAPSTVVLQLPDGQVRSVTDARINQYWGDTFGVQLRRPAAGDGYAEFTAVAAAR